MFNKSLLIFVSLFSVVFAQYNEDAILFTISGDQVKVKEFVRVYTKNNINNQSDFSENSLNEYLDLYKKFRLKVKEAVTTGMDTVPAFISELASYRSQLTQSYLSDSKATDALINEAYERMQEEVNVSHILIFWPNANPSKADSAIVKNELLKIKKEAEKTSFEEQIAIYNKSNVNKYPNNKQKYEGGKLGFITVFQTVYPFENAMYKTEKGTISEPTATRFGYHLVYVSDKRKARGKMQTAHILIKSKGTDSPENQKIAAEKAQQIYSEINNSKSNFDEAVKKYSEDKKTKYQKGNLPVLSSAEMLEPFADAAFSLKNDGDFSKPVKTKIGWHIIKRVKKDEIKEFDFVKSDLEKRVERDSRSNVAKELMINDSKIKFGFSINENAKSSVFNELSNSRINGRFNLSEEKFSQTIFTIGKKSFNQSDFIKFIKRAKTNPKKDNLAVVSEQFKNFQNNVITTYREDNLEDIDEDFKNLMQEYHDGILLFELTNQKVWTKAVDDTTGLNNFFEKNKDNYIWKNRIVYTTYTSKNEKNAETVKKYLTKNKSKAFILKKLNKKEELITTIDFTIEENANDVVKALKWEQGNVSEEKNLDGTVVITYVEKILKPENKKLAETRGYVISDYQDFLEDNWIGTLSKKFPISVNNAVFKSLIK